MMLAKRVQVAVAEVANVIGPYQHDAVQFHLQLVDARIALGKILQPVEANVLQRRQEDTVDAPVGYNRHVLPAGLAQQAVNERPNTNLCQESGFAAGEGLVHEPHLPRVKDLFHLIPHSIHVLPRQGAVVELIDFGSNLQDRLAATIEFMGVQDSLRGLACPHQWTGVDRIQPRVAQRPPHGRGLTVPQVREFAINAGPLNDAIAVARGLPVADEVDDAHWILDGVRRDIGVALGPLRLLNAAHVPGPVRRRDLEQALEAIPRHPSPQADLEQYRTPASVAVDLLWEANLDGAIKGRRVLDLGCGTGIFAIGAALLGAESVVGVDVDAASLELGQSAAAAGTMARVMARIGWVHADLADWHPERGSFDTVLMNPPFGAQKANRRADRLFYQRAAEAIDERRDASVWFLAQPRGEAFLRTYLKELGLRLERIAVWDYPLEATMAHHENEVRTIPVGGYRAAR